MFKFFSFFFQKSRSDCLKISPRNDETIVPAVERDAVGRTTPKKETVEQNFGLRLPSVAEMSPPESENGKNFKNFF